jgi:hypothetical protein
MLQCNIMGVCHFLRSPLHDCGLLKDGVIRSAAKGKGGDCACWQKLCLCRQWHEPSNEVSPCYEYPSESSSCFLTLVFGSL